METPRQAHWRAVYADRSPEQLSWYRSQLEVSLAMIARSGVSLSAPVIDVGGGASTLVDDLLGRGFTDITVLDVAWPALERARERLGPRAGQVQWIEADITEASLEPGHYALWHDRAVIHFLVDDIDREAYLTRLRAALRPDGQVVISTFSLVGPERCSGLPVRRYGVDELAAALGPDFELREHRQQPHHTPRGTPQDFIHARFARAGEQGP